mgnify:CR=1 FL=1
MAGYFRYTALLDACVLYAIAIADSLLSLAVAGFYAAKWTTKIEDEWIAALEKNRPDIRGKLGTRRNSMRSAIPDVDRCNEAIRGTKFASCCDQARAADVTRCPGRRRHAWSAAGKIKASDIGRSATGMRRHHAF